MSVEFRLQDLDWEVGLEIASSLKQVNDLKYLWLKKTFPNSADFKIFMLRDRLLNIRSALRFYSR